MLRALATLLLLTAPAREALAPSPSELAGPLPESRSPLGERLFGDWPRVPSGKHVSLTGKLRLDDALEKVAEAAGLRLVASTGEAGEERVLLHLRAEPVEQALEVLLEAGSLVAVRHGDTVRVAPRSALSPPGPALLGFEPPSGKKVSADFSDTPLEEALRRLADAGGWSLVLPEGLRGVATAQFRDAPVEEALRALLARAGLDARREGSVVTVSRAAESPPSALRGGKKHLVLLRSGGEGLRGEEAGEGPDARPPSKRSRPASKAPDRIRGGDLSLSPGERLGDVVSLRGSVRMAPGSSARQATAVFGSVELEPGATVDEDVVAIGGQVHVSPGAHVAGDAVSIGGEVVVDPGAAVDGDDVSVAIPGLGGLAALLPGAGGSAGSGSRAASGSTNFSPLLWALRVLAKFTVFFALALLVLVFAPGRLEAVARGLAQRPWKVLLAGLLGTVAIPVVAVLLVVTVVGIPLVAVEAVALLVAAVLGYSALALFLGRAAPIRSEKAAAVRQLALGTALVVALSEVPVVGWMAMVSAWLVVFGAVLRTRFGQAEAPPLPTAPAP